MSSVKYRNQAAKGQASNDDLHHIINDMHIGDHTIESSGK